MENKQSFHGEEFQIVFVDASPTRRCNIVPHHLNFSYAEGLLCKGSVEGKRLHGREPWQTLP